MSSLDFVAPDEQVFDYWTDGINALLGKCSPIITKGKIENGNNTKIEKERGNSYIQNEEISG